MSLPASLAEVAASVTAPYAWERSVRILPGRIEADRFMLRLHRRYPELVERIPSIVRDFGLPPVVCAEFDAGLPGADSVYLADYGTTRRVYLSSPSYVGPSEVSLAWKWDVVTGAWFTGHYTLYPGIGLAEILQRASAILGGHVWLDAIASNLIRATHESLRHSFYYEAMEDDSPKAAFYTNAYGAEIEMGFHRPMLDVIASYFGVSEQAAPIWDEIAHAKLGTIAGGLSRSGEEYLSFYFGVTVVGSVSADWMITAGPGTILGDDLIMAAR